MQIFENLSVHTKATSLRPVYSPALYQIKSANPRNKKTSRFVSVPDKNPGRPNRVDSVGLRLQYMIMVDCGCGGVGVDFVYDSLKSVLPGLLI